MTFIEEKIRITLQNLFSCIQNASQPIFPVKIARVGYKTENHPPKDAVWEDYNGCGFHFDRDSHAWIHFTCTVPECAENEKWFLRMTMGRENMCNTDNPQSLIYINGETAYQAFDTNHSEASLSAGEKDIYIYFYTSTTEALTLNFSFNLIRKNIDVNRLYYDIKVPYDAMREQNSQTISYNTIRNALDATCLRLDFRNKGSEAFLAGVKEAQDYLTREFYEKECGREENLGEISLIGHTHIDVAWLWTLAQTREKSQRSFSTALKLMEENPDYIFMSSQPQLFQYVKETDPVLYERIKERVADGRFELEGGMWLEADTNLISGESLIRQFLYGKRFMKEEFGIDNHILWLPDVFGYSAALPQIMKKCGIDTFFTTKLNWCETDAFPHDNFIWKGLDGSEVFSVLSDAYVKVLNPKMVVDAMKLHKDKKYSSTHISTFGYGDGGGGPTQEMLENYERLKQGIPGLPKVTMEKAADIIKRIKEQFTKTAERICFTPKWDGELYLEMHRGTYTTIADNKKANRKSEYMYEAAEETSAMANILTDFAYPKETLDKNWIVILRNQFHDIIPGSSIEAVYKDSKAEYAAVMSDGNKMIADALNSLGEKIKSKGGYLAYNPTSFVRTEIVEADGEALLAENIPAHGYAVVTPSKLSSSALASEKALENEFVKVTFDEKYNIVSFYDKEADREVIEQGKAANVFKIFEDYPRSYDAWEITEYYKQKYWISDNVVSAEVINMPHYAGIRVTRSYEHSTFTQLIKLTANSKRLDFVTDIDWHEDHVLLKAVFPLDIYSKEVHCNIQFGYIDRPTHRNTSWDEAKFEISAHKWVDMSDSAYGAALLNDCKYGYSVSENELSLSLLKAPTFPNPAADRGKHHFTYALYPHTGAFSESDVVREGYTFNIPLIINKITANENGKLSDSFSFVSSDTDTVVAETVKKAEDKDGYIVRVYEAQNAKRKASLTFGFDISAAYECDMLENIEKPLTPNNRTLSLTFGHFEVKTIRVIPG